MQKHLQTDMDYLLKGGFWLFLGQVFAIVFSLLPAIAFANLIPEETYGQYRYLVAMSSYLILFSMQSIGRGITIATARGQEGSLMPGFFARMRWGALGSVAAVAVSFYYFFQNNPGLGICFLLIGLFVPLLGPSDLYRAYIKGKQMFSFLTKTNAIIQFLFAASLIVALFYTDNIIFIFLTYLFFQTGLNMFFFFKTIKKFPPNNKQDKKAISYGKQLSFIEALDIISGNFDLIVLWHLLGAEVVAVYSFALAIPQKIMGVMGGPVYPLVFPKLSRRTPEELKSNIPKKAFFFFLILLPIVLAYIITAPFIFKIFFPKYLESVFYSQIFSLTILLLPEYLFSYSFMAQMKTKLVYINKLFYPIFRILLLIVFTFFYGIMGAILAILIAQAGKLLLSFILFKKI